MSSRVELVVADLDGTLVDYWQPPSARVLAALAACARRGLPVVAVTARRWAAAAPLLATLRIGPLAVVSGGTEIRHAATGRVVDERRLPAPVVAAACGRIRSAGLQPMVADGHGLRAGEPRRDGPAASRYLRRSGARRVADIALAARASRRVLAMGPRSRIELALRRCVDLPARRTVQGCIVRIDARGERPFELHIAAADKGDGLRAVCHLLGVAVGRTLAIGDSASDLPMLAAAGIGVVMGQADPGMLRPGFVLAPPVAADGAADILERLVLT